MIADNLKNTSIKIVVGNGGKGGGYYLDESNSTYKYPAAGDGGTTNISAFNISLTGGKGGTSSAGGTAGGTGGGEGGYSSTNGTTVLLAQVEKQITPMVVEVALWVLVEMAHILIPTIMVHSVKLV